MGVSDEYISDGYKLTIGRRRTRVTTYENLLLQSTHPIKEGKKKERKPSIPSEYAGWNYFNRMKKRRETIRELSYNSFEFTKSVMLSLTFDRTMVHLDEAHDAFKLFIHRVNDHYDNFRYLATFSRQKNGNWHYHVICNFSPAIKNSQVRELWKNGITYITYLENQTRFDVAVNYLIANMAESAEDTKGKRGYLASKNLERNIVLTSYKEEDRAQFEEAFERVQENKRVILYSTKNHLGIQGERVDEETGEIFRVTIPDREMDEMLANAGYESWDTIYTYLSSSARFDEKFTELSVATPKQKKFKRSKKQNLEEASACDHEKKI